MLYLALAVKQEITGVRRGFFPGYLRYIRFLVIIATGNAVVFYASIFAYTVGMYVGFYIFEIQVVADVAIKLTVKIITRIPFDG